MIYDSSYGTIVFDLSSSEPKVLMIKHKKGHWSFPKGHPESDEDQTNTALRETLEESGLVAQIVEACPTIDEKYIYTNENGELVNKRVRYFLAKPTNSLKLKPQESEVEQCAWLPFNEAMNLITFSEAKKVFREAIKLLDQHRKQFSQP